MQEKSRNTILEISPAAGRRTGGSIFDCVISEIKCEKLVRCSNANYVTIKVILT